MKGGENSKKSRDHSVTLVKVFKKVAGISTAFSRHGFYNPASYTNHTHELLICNSSGVFLQFLKIPFIYSDEKIYK